MQLTSYDTDMLRDLCAANFDLSTLAYNRYLRAREASIDVLIKVAPGIKDLLTPAQYRILPETLVPFMDKRNLQGIRSGTAGGNRFMGGGMGGGRGR
jgi:hypothetical protein